MHCIRYKCHTGTLKPEKNRYKTQINEKWKKQLKLLWQLDNIQTMTKLNELKYIIKSVFSEWMKRMYQQCISCIVAHK